MLRLGIIVICALLIGSCQKTVKAVHFIVPQGYTGPIAVVSHPDFSAPESFRTGQASYSLVVPETAVVCIPTDDIFDGYLPSAEYTDGAEIFHWEGPASDSTTIRGIGSWGIGSWHGERRSSVHWLGVGTKSETEEIEGAFFAWRIEAMMPTGVSISQSADFEGFRRYCAGEA